MTGRIRTQKKIFTPTTNTYEPECFLCQIIDTQEYVIVHRSSMKRIYGDSGEIMVFGRRTEAKIEHRGSREECRRIWQKKEEAQNSTSFDDNNGCEDEDEEEDENENENDEEAIDILTYRSNSKTLSKSCAPNKKRTPLQSTIHFNERPSTMKSTKRIKRNDFENEIQVLRGGTSSDDEVDESHLNVSSASSIIQHLDVVLDSIRQENQKYFVQLSKKIEKNNHANDIDISAYREPGTSQIQEDVMHGNINLLLIRGKSVGDYARQVLRSLYSREELTSSILPPGGEQFARKPLNNQRFEKLHRALRCKYNISGSRYDEFFHKLLRPKLVDFLSDERKRARKSESTKSPPSSSCDRD
ncbi:unnamed protein product [Rotaria magnacalcarata]|uniref:Uncharacterized protein n=1 Tax=Rotaria magnacalcarata TaxID=392030 RepID=A0A816W8Q5_9BILA|nr:unnamed protein product [Rotaria magnacalcarata]